MALTRKFLSALGIEAEKVDEIINAHSETVNALKAERDEFKEKIDKFDEVQKELDDLKKSTEGSEKLKEDYDKLKKEYDDYKSEQDAKATKAAKEDAYKKLLTEAGVSEKRLATILKVSDLSKIEIDNDGNVKDADKHKEDIKTEWADFITKNDSGKKGADVSHPPKATGGDGKPVISRAAQIEASYHNSLYGGETKKGEN